MRTRTRIATIVAGGLISTALLSSPSLAAGQRDDAPANPTTTRAQTTAGTCDGTASGTGTGRQDRASSRGGQNGQGAAGTGRGAGTAATLAGVASGTLTDAQKTTLASIAEDEKLAHDLSTAFADQYSVPVFTRIAAAETQHLTAVRVLLDRYDLADPTAGLPAGTFDSAELQKLYDSQLAAGSIDLAAAYDAGSFVETTDIAAVTAATTDLDAPDVELVYANLLAGSERHLVAFGG